MSRISLAMSWTLAGLLGLSRLGTASDAVVAWPAGPLEVRVAFDRPLEPAKTRELVGRSISFGGPTPLGALRIAGARLADDGRTLVLATDPHPREATYRLPLPGGMLDYDLNGVEVAWDNGEEGAVPAWSGWWPVVDSSEARRLTSGSVEHEHGFALLGRPGRLVVRTFVAVPKGKVTVRLEADGDFEATLSNEEPTRSKNTPDGRKRVEWDQESTGDSVELSAHFPTGGKGRSTSIRATIGTSGKPAERPLAHAMLSLPWAPPPLPTAAPPPPLPFALKGGDRARGEALFFGEEAKCSACHKVRGRGGDVGPDLSTLAGRDPAEIYREIAEPSAVIKPEFLPYNVARKDGQVAVGVVRAEDADTIKVLDTNGKANVIPRAEVEELRPSGTSIMPVGLAGALGEEKMRDLLTFLLGPVVKERP